jgi:hypothetical protein
MRNANALVRAAIKRNGKDFKKWIKNTPNDVPAIDEIRRITSKIDYSMSKTYISEKESD